VSDIQPQQAFGCAYCFMVSKPGEPPHGWDVPCPLKVSADEAYIAKLEAERDYYSRGGPYGDMLKKVLRR